MLNWRKPKDEAGVPREPTLRERVEARRGIVRAPQRSWWQRWGGSLVALVVGLVSAALYIACFPPFDFAEAAFGFAVPWALWAAFRPRWRLWWTAAFFSQWFAWSFLLIWLRHVAVYVEAPFPQFTGAALVLLLAAVVAALQMPWFGAVRWAIGHLRTKVAGVRLVALFGLAGVWVLQEWVRSWIFSGFPWLVLAASQWRNPVALQPAAYGGAFMVSFLLIAVNLALGMYVLRFFGVRRARGFVGSLCLEFYVVFGLLALTLLLYVRELPQAENMRGLFTAAVVQPAIEQSVKWDPAMGREHLRVLEEQTRLATVQKVDVVLWPETATPVAVRTQEGGLEAWITRLSREIQTPILMGNLIQEDDGRWYNGIFFVEPEGGLRPGYYAKRKRVPFGEYIPLRQFLPFVNKAVPLDFDIDAGTRPHPLILTFGDKRVRVGGLVCYEDIFPSLARETARLGVDVFFVATNNAWYGREAGAYQHAAHSVLRAVETRRPVVRCGNEGWSGWIDSQGRIRLEMTNGSGSIYTRGSAPMLVFYDERQAMRPSFYVRFGDWFVVVSALLALSGFGALRWGPDLKDVTDGSGGGDAAGNVFARKRRLWADGRSRAKDGLNKP